jgi:hypothetical protein
LEVLEHLRVGLQEALQQVLVPTVALVLVDAATAGRLGMVALVFA